MVFNRFRASTSLPEAGEAIFAIDSNRSTIKCAINQEKMEVAAIKVRRNFFALQRSIPELAYLSPERLAEIAGILATAPL